MIADWESDVAAGLNRLLPFDERQRKLARHAGLDVPL
jgi:hypothetical protein